MISSIGSLSLRFKQAQASICSFLNTQRWHNSYARIEELAILPTNEQGIACIRVSQILSNYYRNVELFRFDDDTGDIYIFSSEEIQILIQRDGNWRFIQ